MAKPQTTRFGRFLVMLGTSGASPVYTAPCGFTSKSLTLSKDLTDFILPDCENADAPAWIGRDVASMSASVTGEGVLAAESITAWLAAYDSPEPTPVKITLATPSTVYTWGGFMHLASLQMDAEQGGRVQLSIEMQSDGELVQTSAPVTP